jgi:hypothetical protein
MAVDASDYSDFFRVCHKWLLSNTRHTHKVNGVRLG